MSVVCAVLSAENQIGSKRKSTDTADSTAPVCRQHRYLIASSLATITPAAISAAAVTYTDTAATRRPLLARTRLIHSHRPAIHGLAVQLRDRVVRFLLRAHDHQ